MGSKDALMQLTYFVFSLIVFLVSTNRSQALIASDEAAPAIADWLPRADIEDRKIDPRSWQRAKCVVLVFLNPECPVVNSYAPELARLSESFRGDVAFLGVHSDPSVTSRQAVKHAEEFAIPFPVAFDGDQKIAARVGVQVTPEVVVIAGDGTRLYRGRIDDRYSETGKRRDEPRRRDLELALREALAGKPIEVTQTKAFGCPIPQRKETTSRNPK